MRWTKRLLIALLISPFALLVWHFYDTYWDGISVNSGFTTHTSDEDIYTGDRDVTFHLHPLLLYYLGSIPGAGQDSLMIRQEFLPFGVQRVNGQLHVTRYPPIRFKVMRDEYDYPFRAFIRCGRYVLPGSGWAKYTIEGEEISTIVAQNCPGTRYSNTIIRWGYYPADVTAALERAIE